MFQLTFQKGKEREWVRRVERWVGGRSGKAGEKEPKKIKTFSDKKDSLRDKKGYPYALFRIVVPILFKARPTRRKNAGRKKKASPSYGRWKATRHFEC